ncbi:DedA family protein [Psychromicrobium sp. YIM B11713]|uniref:DedA family protein n=1 Tax=Psychromicrobium sp. YIM B11713 TaxID=3145233 RepID=UPI00374EB8A1
MDFIAFFSGLNELITHSASQWWVVPIVTLFCFIDGFFLFLPSETAIVALSAVALHTGEPNIWYLMAGGAIGAILGDNTAYWIGSKVGTAGFKWMRRPKVAKAMEWARMELDKRGAVLVLTARYIPVGRVAVNFTAGATRYPWRKFVWLDAIASITWSAYGVAIGTFAGHWIRNNHLLGVAIAIVFAIIMGFVVDHLMKLFHRWLGKRAERKQSESGASEASAAEAETIAVPRVPQATDME